MAMGTVLEPRGVGVADARGRRAASPRGWWVVKAIHSPCVCVRWTQGGFISIWRFFPLASVSAIRHPASAKKPHSGVFALMR